MIAIINLPDYNSINRNTLCDYIKKTIVDSINKNKDTQLEINFDGVEKEKESANKNKIKWLVVVLQRAILMKMHYLKGLEKMRK